MAADPDCIFCKIVSGAIPSDKVYEDEAILAFHDIQPQAPTHILVIPKEHRPTLREYGPEDAALLGRIQAAAIQIAREQGVEAYRCVYNCGAEAGQAVFHLHLHLLAGRAFAWPPG